MDTEPRTGFSTLHAVVCACSCCRDHETPRWEIPVRCQKCGGWCTTAHCLNESIANLLKPSS